MLSIWSTEIFGLPRLYELIRISQTGEGSDMQDHCGTGWPCATAIDAANRYGFALASAAPKLAPFDEEGIVPCASIAIPGAIDAYGAAPRLWC